MLSDPQSHLQRPDPATEYLPATIPSFEDKVTDLGKKILAGIRVERASILSKQYWSQRFMEWSTKTPSLKRNLFRLVDVLPSLESSDAISDHIAQYLGDEASTLPTWAAWGIRPPGSATKAIMASGVKIGRAHV